MYIICHGNTIGSIETTVRGSDRTRVRALCRSSPPSTTFPFAEGGGFHVILPMNQNQGEDLQAAPPAATTILQNRTTTGLGTMYLNLTSGRYEIRFVKF